jgi:hypothetical protein
MQSFPNFLPLAQQFNMKFLATFLAVSVAVVAAAPECELSALRGLVTSPDVTPCSTDSGYTLIPPNAPPTDDEVAKMCESSACMNLISSVLATNPIECQIPIGGKILLRADLLDKVSNACNAPAPDSETEPEEGSETEPEQLPAVIPSPSEEKPAC